MRKLDSQQRSEQTNQVWEKRAGRKLINEDLRQIEQNVIGFFRVLVEWTAKENGKDNATPGRNEEGRNER